jgi:two-component sensor histidine kinase
MIPMPSALDRCRALSAPPGRVALAAGVERGEGGAELLRVMWEETGGPPVGKPERTGFGTAMITRAIAYQHTGTVELEWREGGLRCCLSLPLEEATGPRARERPRRWTGLAAHTG